jgi:hypothetical protein
MSRIQALALQDYTLGQSCEISTLVESTIAGAFVSSAVHVLKDAVTDGCAFLARWLF